MRTKHSKQNILIRIFIIFLLLFINPVFADDVQLTGVAVSNSGNQTQIVINLSNPTNYSVFSLSTPNRVVIDLKSTTLATTTDQTNLSNTPILHIRHGHPTPDTYRIVLDVDKPLKYSSVLNGNQLVVTLVDASAPTANNNQEGIFSGADETKQTINNQQAAATPTPAVTATETSTSTETAIEAEKTPPPTKNDNLQQAKKWAQENLQAELQGNIDQESTVTSATQATPTPAPASPTSAVTSAVPVVKSTLPTSIKNNNFTNNNQAPVNKPKNIVATPVVAAPTKSITQTKPATPIVTNTTPNKPTITTITNVNVVKSNPTTVPKPTALSTVKSTPTKTTTVSSPTPTKTPTATQTTSVALPTIITAPPATGNHYITVVIDPGHGGKDPGTTGSFGVREKDVVLAISKDLYADLAKQPGYHPVLTRNADYFIPLRGRLAIARQAHGDMFIAIHADAYSDSYATGASVYALSAHGASSEAARWLAEKENYSELGGVTLTDKSDVLRSVLIDLSQTATISSSIQLGTNLLSQLNTVGTLHHNVVEQAPFMVLKSPDIPSVLVETGFLSSPSEEARLHNPIHQEEIALALAKGIENYFWNNPPPGTTIASLKNSSKSN